MSIRINRHALSVVLVAGVFVAADLARADDPPRTQAVSGTFTAKPVNAKQRQCVGADGPYIEVSGTFAGNIVSTDPRVTGTLEFLAHALINVTTGLGNFEGSFSIRSAAPGGGARGIFFTVVTDGGLNHGFARGTLGGGGHDDGEDDRGHDGDHGGGGPDFFARYQAVTDAALNVTGAFGGPGDPRAPAIIQSGRCSGRWTKVPTTP
jgi:hypothetical protein